MVAELRRPGKAFGQLQYPTSPERPSPHWTATPPISWPPTSPGPPGRDTAELARIPPRRVPARRIATGITGSDISTALEAPLRASSSFNALTARRVPNGGIFSVPAARLLVLFQVLTEREESSAVAIAAMSRSRVGPRPLPWLRAAIVGRLTFAGQIIEASITSYRLAHAHGQRSATQARQSADCK